MTKLVLTGNIGGMLKTWKTVLEKMFNCKFNQRYDEEKDILYLDEVK